MAGKYAHALHLARLALAYAMEEDITYILPAIRLARFALRVIASWGATLIHEIGHTWLGGGHCRWECCFEHAERGWLCNAVSLLGLPWGEDYPEWTTLPEAGWACVVDIDWTHGLLHNRAWSSCTLPEPFVPGHEGEYIGLPCIPME